MADKSSADPLEVFQISKEFLVAQQKFMPSTQVYARMAEVVRNMAQANAAYMQELMRANAAWLAAYMERPASGTEERPSDAAHRPDCEAP
jgi:hypothetical protein